MKSKTTLNKCTVLTAVTLFLLAFPLHIHSMPRKAVRLLDSQEYSSALDILLEYLRKRPSDAEAHYSIGYIYQLPDHEDLSLSETSLSEALKLAQQQENSDLTNRAESLLADVREKRDSREWYGAKWLGTTPAYERYLTRYPQGQHASDAIEELERLRLIEAWEQASEIHSIAGYEEFIEQCCPNGHEEAEGRIYELISAGGNEASLQNYLTYTDSTNWGHEERYLNDTYTQLLAFYNKRSKESLNQFLSTYPEATNRKEVVALRDSIPDYAAIIVDVGGDDISTMWLFYENFNRLLESGTSQKLVQSEFETDEEFSIRQSQARHDRRLQSAALIEERELTAFRFELPAELGKYNIDTGCFPCLLAEDDTRYTPDSPVHPDLIFSHAGGPSDWENLRGSYYLYPAHILSNTVRRAEFWSKFMLTMAGGVGVEFSVYSRKICTDRETAMKLRTKSDRGDYYADISIRFLSKGVYIVEGEFIDRSTGAEATFP